MNVLVTIVLAVLVAVLPLRAGWTYVGLPLDPVGHVTAQSALRQTGCSQLGWLVDGSWETVAVGGGDFALDVGAGYMVRCDQTSTWRIKGHEITSGVPIQLGVGFTSASFPKMSAPYTAQTLLDAIVLQGGSCSEVDRWGVIGWDGYIDGMGFNDFPIEPGQGYLLVCDHASVFIP